MKIFNATGQTILKQQEIETLNWFREFICWAFRITPERSYVFDIELMCDRFTTHLPPGSVLVDQLGYKWMIQKTKNDYQMSLLVTNINPIHYLHKVENLAYYGSAF